MLSNLNLTLELLLILNLLKASPIDTFEEDIVDKLFTLLD